MSMEFRTLAASADDEPFLRELLRDVRDPEFLQLNLPEAGLAQLMDLQYRAQKQGYEQQFPNLESTILWVGPYRVGRMLLSETVDSMRLVDIALLTAFRGTGIGSRILESLCQRAREAGRPLRLSVRRGNRAINLYTRIGFVMRGDNGMDIEMEWGGREAKPAVVGEPGSEEGSCEPGPNGSYFRGLRGTRAIFRPSVGAPLVLRLAAVTSLRPDRDTNVALGDSFALTFESESTVTLPQGVYLLEFEDGYRMDTFLVPVALENGLATYESIFNRMHRKATVSERSGTLAEGAESMSGFHVP